MTDKIISETRNIRYLRDPDPSYPHGIQQVGLDLRMADGSTWFHPYSGGAPRCIKPAGVKA